MHVGVSRAKPEARARLLVLAVLASACSGGGIIADPRDPARNAGLSTPWCRDDRPLPKNGVRQHVCWAYGERTDLALSASCRIDAHGRAACWRDNLVDAPSGSFSAIDDDGYDACAIDSGGRAVCWGSARGGWISTPRLARFVAVSVGRMASPLHMGREYACGLTTTGQIMCWEAGPAAAVFLLHGEFTAMEAGNDTVCGITREGEMKCLDSIHTLTPRPPPAGTFSALSLGTGVERCVLDAAHRASCEVVGEPVIVDGVRAIRAGTGHACMVGVDGTINCIGDAPPPPNVRVRYLSRPAGVSDNYCAITVDSERLCWGDPTP